LVWLILIPFVGGAAAWLAGGRSARWISLAACTVQFLFALACWLSVDGAALPGGIALDQRANWIPAWGISVHLVMDGLSLILVLLAGLLGVIAVVSSWREVQAQIGAFHFGLLAVVTGVTGVFLARDLLLFYFFWELMLVPMYFLIGLWGHERRIYASVKFFIFTFIGSLLMLAAILGLVFIHQRTSGVLTFDAAELIGTPLTPTQAAWLMLGFFLAFAVKLPAVPFHTWLADAHTEAPTGGSVLLAGLLLKTGAYGMLRFALPLFPVSSRNFSSMAGVLGVAGILYGAVLAFAQTDFKRMVAYSSVSHMGFVLLGIYAGNQIALEGAVMQIVSHGVSTGALFFLAGSIQERTGTRDLGRLGGLWQTAPRLGGMTMLFALAALGLPGMGNFLGEFLVLLGTFKVFPGLAILGSAGFILSTVYALRLVQESMHGPNHERWQMNDLSAQELTALGIMATAILWLGLHPQPLFLTVRAPLTSIEHAVPRATEIGANVSEPPARRPR
jgi:NADH-quinone oxidoreductase subunit M